MDGLTKQLDAFMTGLMERADPGTAATLRASVTALEQAGVVERALKAGDQAPDFILPDQTGKSVSLRDLLKSGPVVLTFFRGGWCPFCTLTLRALAAIQPKLRRLGAELVAISPETPSNAAATVERNGLNFPVLTDFGNRVAREYRLVWELDEQMRALYERLGHPLPKMNGDNEWTLPLPAGFVVAQDGRISYAHVHARVDRRIEPQAALAAVQQLDHSNGE